MNWGPVIFYHLGGGGGLGGRGWGDFSGGNSFQGGMERLTVILDRALWGKGTLGN